MASSTRPVADKPKPGYCVACKLVQARTYEIESAGYRLCDSHVRIAVAESQRKS